WRQQERPIGPSLSVSHPPGCGDRWPPQHTLARLSAKPLLPVAAPVHGATAFRISSYIPQIEAESAPMATAGGGPGLGRGISGLALFFHVRKTVALAQAVLQDTRVHWLPKIAFVTGIGTLLLALVFPELVADLIALEIPGIGLAFDALGLPTE